VASAADIVAAIGATFVTNATNATNATTVNVGGNDAATATPVFLSWVSAASGNQPTKFQVLIIFCSFYWVFYQQQVLRKWCCTNLLQQLT
jgi:hypothetical protein